MSAFIAGGLDQMTFKGLLPLKQFYDFMKTMKCSLKNNNPGIFLNRLLYPSVLAYQSGSAISGSVFTLIKLQ